MIDNPSWQAPEVLKATKDKLKETQHVRDVIAVMGRHAKKALAKHFKQKDADTLMKEDNAGTRARKDKAEQTVAPFEVHQSADVWAADVIAYEIAHGVSPFEAKPGEFMSDQEDRIIAFGSNP